MPRFSRPRLFARVTRVILSLLAATWIVSLAGVMLWERRDDARLADAIIVLGAAQYDGRPSPVLRARLDHALSLWERRLAPYLILTGGMGDGDTTSEAAVGRRYAVKHGVPDSAILMETRGRTMLAKIWDQHVIARIGDDTDLLHVDRHLLHDLGGSRGLLDLKSRNLTVHNPELTFATPDHAISTARGRAGTSKVGQELLAGLRAETSAAGIEMFDVDEPGQGIVHVIGPELGLSLPGLLQNQARANYT